MLKWILKLFFYFIYFYCYHYALEEEKVFNEVRKRPLLDGNGWTESACYANTRTRRPFFNEKSRWTVTE